MQHAVCMDLAVGDAIKRMLRDARNLGSWTREMIEHTTKTKKNGNGSVLDCRCASESSIVLPTKSFIVHDQLALENRLRELGLDRGKLLPTVKPVPVGRYTAGRYTAGRYTALGREDGENDDQDRPTDGENMQEDHAPMSSLYDDANDQEKRYLLLAMFYSEFLFHVYNDKNVHCYKADNVEKMQAKDGSISMVEQVKILRGMVYTGNQRRGGNTTFREFNFTYGTVTRIFLRMDIPETGGDRLRFEITVHNAQKWGQIRDFKENGVTAPEDDSFIDLPGKEMFDLTP